MPIKKQEFYEGAALHLLARTGQLRSISYKPPFFTLNDRILVLLKYSTKGRSPWGFTFMPEEQKVLAERATAMETILGFVCGADGVAAITYDGYASIAMLRSTAIHVGCFRDHGKHYEISGPDGALAQKVAPSRWQRILEEGGRQ